MTAGSALCAKSTWPQALSSTETGKKRNTVTPIRALLRKGGMLVQPIEITIENQVSAGTAVTKLDGVELDRRTVQPGSAAFEVYVKPVASAQNVTLNVEVDGAEQTHTVELKPVRNMLIYVLPHSHHDLGYTDRQADVEQKQIRNITRGIELARKTAGYPEGARFVWNLEVLWGADLYMQRGSENAKADLVDAVRRGWIGINGSYANELTGLCRPEELLQLFRYSGQLGKTCGVKVDSAMMSDVPGFSWGTVTAMAQAGIRYFSAAPNYFDRIGTFMVTWQDKPFWWISPSGKEKILFWVPWTGYALSHVMKVGNDLVAKYQDRMDEIHYPYDISYIRWSGHGDNAEPDPEISEWIRDWNQKYEWPRFSIASTSTAFSAFEKRYGNQLPQYRGDLTPYWEDGAASSAQETAISRQAADRLSEAGAVSALSRTASYSTSNYAKAWRDVLLYSEHTWGAWNSVSDSEKPFVKQQWDVKRAFAMDADKMSRELLSSAIGANPSSVSTSTVEIQNTTSWDRSEVIYLSREISAAGDHVIDSKGKPVPSQRLSTGELAVSASNVPAFGSARYSISSTKAYSQGKAASYRDGILENGILQAKIDPSTGDITEFRLHGHAQNLVSRENDQNVNRFLYMAGKDVDHLQSSGLAKIMVEDHGPLVVSIRIESSAPTCNSLVRTMRLAAGDDHLELVNVIDKQRAPLNPHPGIGGPGDEFAQRGSKESIQFAFPFAIPDGKLSMDIALGNMHPEVDQLPGSCKNWFPVGRWIDISNAEVGITWITQDAPLVEIGSISATMLGSQRDPSVWRKHIEPTQTFYSWVMNNHWGTNYRAYQEGPVTFRYALQAHRQQNAARASKLAIAQSQPLLVSPAQNDRMIESLLRIEPSDVIALTLKPSDDGEAWILRLFGASGEARQARVHWNSSLAGKVWRSNLAEEQLQPVEGDISVDGWELVTLRAEKRRV